MCIIYMNKIMNIRNIEQKILDNRYDGLSFKDIAAKTGQSPSRVHQIAGKVVSSHIKEWFEEFDFGELEFKEAHNLFNNFVGGFYRVSVRDFKAVLCAMEGRQEVVLRVENDKLWVGAGKDKVDAAAREFAEASSLAKTADSVDVDGKSVHCG
jgi:hypothetical protein